MINLSNAYAEVLVILLNMDNGFHSIPYKDLEILKKGCNLKHNFKLQTGVPLNQQKLLDETKAILSIFYKKYWSKNEKNS